MQRQYDAWQKGSHHTVAVCIDCHVPGDFVPKYLAKAENGFRHSKEFTSQNFHEPILVKPRGMEILQANCLRCHGSLVHQLGMADPGGTGYVPCVHCHATVGHGERAGLGGPFRPGEIPEIATPADPSETSP
jgi:cytochrome c nitrite reductase small subunit